MCVCVCACVHVCVHVCVSIVGFLQGPPTPGGMLSCDMTSLIVKSGLSTPALTDAQKFIQNYHSTRATQKYFCVVQET